MIDQAKQTKESLVSAGKHGLVHVGVSNPLVSRGLADIARWTEEALALVTGVLPVSLSIPIKGELLLQPCGSGRSSLVFLAKAPGMIEISAERIATSLEERINLRQKRYQKLLALNAPELILENERRMVSQLVENWKNPGGTLLDYWFTLLEVEVITNEVANELLRLNTALRLHMLHLRLSKTADITFLSQFHGISVLELELDRQHSAKVDDDLQLLRHLPGLNLLSLNLDGSDVTDQGLAHLSHIRNVQETTELSMNECGAITDEGLRHLSSFSGLGSLRLAGCSITGNGLAHLSELRSLKELNLDGCVFNDESLIHLRPLSQLNELSLSRFHFDSDILKIHPSDRKTSPAYQRGLRRFQLILSRGITDDGLVHLSAFSSLNTLHLDGQPIEGAGLGHLCDLSHLEKLRLNNCELLSDRCVIHLSALTGLKELYLGNSQITDAGLDQLITPDWSGYDCLTALGLSYCRGITDRGIRYIAELSGLTWLSLSGTKVTDEGLASLSCLSNLRQLYLPREGGVTRAGVDTLQQALPECEIVF
jgi:hypothetical protein